MKVRAHRDDELHRGGPAICMAPHSDKLVPPGTLEARVHLQAPVIRSASIAPAPLVRVDAKQPVLQRDRRKMSRPRARARLEREHEDEHEAGANEGTEAPASIRQKIGPRHSSCCTDAHHTD